MNAGEIAITLPNLKDGGEDTLILKPTLRAIKLLSRNEGGLMNVANQLMVMNLDTMVRVIDVGVGLTERGKEGLEERIFRRGLTELTAPLVRYVHILSNGGRLPNDTPTDEDQGGNS